MLGSLVLVSLLIVSAYAIQCQYFFNTDLGYPIGIDRCSAFVQRHKGEKPVYYSFKYECISSDIAVMYTYLHNSTCEGKHTHTRYTSSNGTFDCSSSDLNCGKLFGYKSPCDCIIADEDCADALEIALVDQTCVTVESDSGYISYDWQITCGSLSKANAVLNTYKGSSSCSGSSTSKTLAAGCSSNYDYLSYNSSEVDIIICPGNMASFWLSLFTGVIIVVFFS